MSSCPLTYQIPVTLPAQRVNCRFFAHAMVGTFLFFMLWCVAQTLKSLASLFQNPELPVNGRNRFKDRYPEFDPAEILRNFYNKLTWRR